MKFKLTTKFDGSKEQWRPIMVCPLCGYESTVTNIHRNCLKAPTDVETIRPIYCYSHEMYHYKDGKPTTHDAVIMKYSGRLILYNKDSFEGKEREFHPDENTVAQLWSGPSVEFEEE